MEIDFTQPPQGYVFSTYHTDDRSIALVPDAYRDVNVNDLPLEEIEHYYWAETTDDITWVIMTYDRVGQHSTVTPVEHDRESMRKHLLVLAHIDVIFEQVKTTQSINHAQIEFGKALLAGYQFFNINQEPPLW